MVESPEGQTRKFVLNVLAVGSQCFMSWVL